MNKIKTIKTFIITIILLLTFITLPSPVLASTQLPKVETVNQALWVLNHQFPDWYENYEEGKFDCSEMSAFVYDYLKYCGLNPQLQHGRGRDVWGYAGWSNHVWVLCQNKNIECVRLQIVPDSYYKGFKLRYMPYVLYENDWWNSEYLKSKDIVLEHYISNKK